MAKEKGKIESAINKTIHHFDKHKVRLMIAAGCLDLETLEYRFSLAENNLKPVLEVLKKVREAAKKGDVQAVIEALNTEVEFGHELECSSSIS